MIWNIIRGKTVVYKAVFNNRTLHIDGSGACIVGNIYIKT